MKYHRNNIEETYYFSFLHDKDTQYYNGMQSAEEPQDAFINTRERMAEELKLNIEEAFSQFEEVATSVNTPWGDIMCHMLKDAIGEIDFAYYAEEELNKFLLGRKEGLSKLNA